MDPVLTDLFRYERGLDEEDRRHTEREHRVQRFIADFIEGKHSPVQDLLEGVLPDKLAGALWSAIDKWAEWRVEQEIEGERGYGAQE